MKNISIFLSENFQFLEVKFSIYLNRRVFVMSGILFFKGSVFLKNRHFITQERFNKLIYGINTAIKSGT